MLEAFSKAGDVLRIVMGLDKQQRTPCGFAFGERRVCFVVDCLSFCVCLLGVRGRERKKAGVKKKLTFFSYKKK